MSRMIVRRKLATAKRGIEAGEGGSFRRLTRLAHQSLALLLSGLLVLQPTIANAQSVSASTTAPAANQPSVGAAPNGVPLIDIVTPNAAGLSHNKYDNFNVGTQGVILNNYKGEVGISNLGGATPGNPNLNASNPASVILNEVTSGNRSALNGPTEIFGTKADVVIANPNGITCDGCGFINTPHATLTTGVPNIGADGSLTGFTLNGGDVTFQGNGGNFAAGPGAVDLFDVVSRSIHVNGPVYGKTLRLTAGASKYDYATGEATALSATSGTPEYAIDGTALGAMQADRIKVVVTEKGAGVNMSGDMAANGGELSLSSDGKISIGNASGAQGVTITSKSKVTAAKVSSKAKIAVQADQGITLQSVAADSDIVLSSGSGLLSVASDTNSAANVQMTSAGGISAANVTAGGTAALSASAGNVSLTGAASSNGELSIAAASGTITAASLLSHGNIGLNAGLDIAVSGNVFAQGKIAATGRSMSTGMIASGLDIAATQAAANGKTVLASAADLQLTANGAISTAGLLSSGNVAINAASLSADSLTAHGAVSIDAATGTTTASGRVDVAGQLLASGDISIDGKGIQAATIASGVDFAATDAAGGNIVLGPAGTLDLTAGAGTIVVDTLLSAGDLNAQTTLLQANDLTSHGNVDVDGGVDVSDQLLSAGDVTINGNGNGVSADLLASGVDFAATKAAGGNIVLTQSGDLAINDSAGAIQAGTMLAAGAINAVGQAITADTITGHKNISLTGATGTTTTSGRVDISSQVLGAGNVSVSGSSIKADAIVSGVDIAATDAAGGRIVLGPSTAGTGNLALSAAGTLEVGTLLSAGNFTAHGAAITADSVTAHGDLALDGATTVSGQILGAGNVLITGQSLSAQTVVAGIDLDATNTSSGNIVLSSAGDLTVLVNGDIAASTIEAAGSIDASGTTITADDVTGHKDITLSGAIGTTAASGRVDVNDQVLGGSDISISGSSIKAGAIVSGVDFTGTAASGGGIVLTNSGDLTLAASGALNAGTLLSAGDLKAIGSSITADSVTAHGDMTLGGAGTTTASGHVDVNGQILGAGNVLITGQSLSAQTVVAGIDYDATDAAGGNIVLGQAGDLTVAINGAMVASTIQAAGSINASGATITANAVTGHKDITLSGATGTATGSGLVDISGQVLGGGDIGISGSSITAGAIASGVDFAATAASGGAIVLAGRGDLTLTASGALKADTLLSAGDLSATGSTVTADSVSAHGDMTLNGAINVADQILGSGNVSITGQSLTVQTLAAGIDFDATDAAGGNIALGQAGDLTVLVNGAAAMSTVQAAGAIDVSATTISSDAVTGHKDITLSGATTANGQILGGNDVSISGPSIKADAIVSGFDFARTAAANGSIVQTTSGDLTLASSGAIDVSTLLSAGSLSAIGTALAADSVTAHGDLTLGGATGTTTASSRVDVSGQILGSGNVLITGQSLSAQTVVAGIDFGAAEAAGGTIVLGHAGDLTVSVSNGIAASTIQAAGTIDASGATITADAVTAHKDITLSGATTVNSQVLGGNDVSISGPSIKAGAIVSGVDFAGTAAANGNIVLASSGDLTLASAGNVNTGTLLSAGSLSATGTAVTANSVTAHGDLTLQGAATINGQILSAGDVLITGQSLSAQTVIAGIDFDATNASGGEIVLSPSGDLTVSVNGGIAASTIQAAGAIDASAATITADTVTGHKDITLSGATDISGQVLGGSNVDISGTSIEADAIVSGVDFARMAAGGGNIVLAGGGGLSLASAGDITIGTLLSAGSLSAIGASVAADSVTAHGDITLSGTGTTTASGRVDVNGQILGAGNVLITGQSLSAQTVIAGIDFDATNASGGTIVLAQSGDLTVSVNGGIAASTVQAAGTIDVSGAAITADAVTGHKGITFSGTTTVNSQVLGGGNVSISGPSIKAGAIVSGVDFAGTAAANGSIVLASSGDLTLASAGNVNASTLLSAGSLSATGATVAADTVTAHGDLTLKGSTTISQILSAGNALITGQSLSAQTVIAGIDFDATNASGGDIVLAQSGDLTVSVNGGIAASTIQAAGAIDASGATITADTVTGHNDITLSGATDISGQIFGGSNVGISGPSIKAAAIVSGVDFAGTAAANGNIVLAASGDLTLASTGNVDTGTLLSAASLSATGTAVTANSVTAHGDLTLKGSTGTTTASGRVDVSGQILSSGNVLITGQSLSAQTVVAGIDFDATNGSGGDIALASNGDLTVAVNGNAQASTLLSAGTIDASGSTITADSITGHKDITLSGATSVNGQVLGGSDISITGSSINTGAIVSGVDFAGTAAANGSIELAASGDLTLASTGNVNTGTLLSAASLSATGSAVTASSVTAHGDLTLKGSTGTTTASGRVDVSGQILGAGNVLITGQSLSAQTVIAGIDFDATNASGGDIALAQSGDLTVSVNGGIAASTIQAAGNIDAGGATITADAVTGRKDITLSGATTVNGQVLGGSDISISGPSIKASAIVSGVDFAGTDAANGNIVLAASGDLTLASAGSVNAGTLLSAGNLSATGSAVTASSVTAHNALTLQGATTINGQILSAGNVLITGQSLSAQTVVAGIDFDATNASGGDIVLASNGNLKVAVSGNAQASTLLSAGTIDASGSTITADTITGHKSVALSGTGTTTASGQVDVGGQILGGSDVSISGSSIEAGAIVSGVDFARTAAAGGTIIQTAGGDVRLAAIGDITLGTLLSAGDLTTQAANLTAGSITSHGNTELEASGTTTASGQVDIDGQVLSGGNLAIDGGSLTAGLLVSGVDFAATEASGGNIVLAPSGAMDLTVAGNAVAGTILSAGDFEAKAAALKAGSITSHGAVGIVGDVDVTSQILAAGDLAITSGSISAPVLISGIDFAATNAAGGNIVLAQSGAINLTATGNIAAQTMLSAGDFLAQAASLTADSITSHGKVAITANGNAGTIAVSNQILSAGDLALDGGSISAPVLISGVDFAATTASGGNIVLGQSGDMQLDASVGIATSTMLSAGTIDANAATIAAGAVTAHGDITLAGGNGVNVTGQLLGASDVSLSGPTVQVNQAITGVDFAATARSSNGAIVLGPTGALDINAGSATAGTLIVAGGLDVAASKFTGGNITSHGGVSIGSSTAPGALAINGQLLGASDVAITGSDISGNVIVAGVDFAATSQSASGNIVLGQAGDLTLKATSGNVTVNSLLAAGSINANAANNVSANAVAHGDLTIAAGNVITLTGQSLAARNVNLAARSMTIDTLVSGVDFAATNAASGGSLMLQRTGAMTLAASGGSISANALLSGGNLAASATQNIGYASLQSLGNAALTAPGTISYTNTTRVGGNLTINTGAIDLSGARGSRIAGGGTLIVNASSANLAGSSLVFGGLALNLSGNADLSNADVSTVTNAGGSGDIAISAAGLITTANTSLLAAHDLTLTLPSLANTGQLAAGNNLTFNVAGDFYNSPSGLVFAGNNANLFVGGVLTNDQGAILAGNGLAIAGPGGGQRNGAVVNSAGLIQSGGSMSILTNGLTNTTTSGPTIQRNVQISSTLLSAYDLITETYKCETRCGTGSGQHEPTYGWTETIDHLVSQIVTEDQLISGAGPSAKIRAGGPLTINAINLTNAYSSIKSDSDMLLTVAGALTNDGATLNRATQTICDSSTPCQYYPDVIKSDTTDGGPDCSGPNNPCVGSNDSSLTYSDNPNGNRDASRDLAAGTTVTVQAIGVLSGVIQARGALAINGGGTVNNVAANGSIAGQVTIDAPATASNPLGALNSMTAGGALFNVNAALAGVAANGGATAASGPSIAGGGPAIGSGPAINGNSLTAAGGTSISGNNLTAAGGASVNGNNLTASGGASVSGNNLTASGGASVNGNNLTAAGSASISGNGLTAASGAPVSGNSLTAAGGTAVNGNSVTAAGGASVSGNSLTASGGAAISSNNLAAGNTSVNPNSLMGKLTAAVGNSGNLAQVLQVNGTQLASLAKPQSGGVGGTVPGQVFLFETRAAFLDVSTFYGSGYFIDRIGYTPETQVPFLGDAYFDNQLIDEQLRQLVGDGLGAGSFIPGNNATDQMKTLLDNGVAYAEANGLALGQALTPEQAASLTQSIVIYQTEIVDGAQVLVPVVYLSAADRAKTTSAATIAGNTVSIDAGSVDNSGAIAAADGMTINATDIKANGGAFLAGGNMNLNATNGITLAAQTMNIGGQTVVTANGGITAGGNLKVDAGAGSLTLSGTKVAAGGSAQLSGQTVTVGAVKQDNGGVQTLVGTTVTTGGNLNISGTNGVNVIASSAKVGGDLSVLSSNGSVNIISAGVENTVLNKDQLSLAQGGTITTTTSLTQQGSSLIAGGAMLVSGDQGILIAGSSLNAAGNLGLVSTNGNIAITASEDQTTSQSKTIAGAANGYKSGQSSSTSLTSNGSSITSGNGSVTVEADNGNVSVIGSDIAAQGGTANLISKGDITIGEATDTASSSSQSGSKKSSEATTTADGSSISGQTGVNIASTGGNVTISASDVTAGDATHTADANIQAAGNIIVASGKDTDETTSDSKSSGFLSSSKTHTQTYDEDTVGSSISATGDINSKAGGVNVLSGSSMDAGGSVDMSGSSVAIIGAQEEHESDKTVKKSGIGVGSGGGFLSIYGSHDKTTSDSESLNVGSSITAGSGDITLKATGGDLNIIGSSVTATQGNINGSASGDINLLPGHESEGSSKKDTRSGFGIQVSASDSSASIGIGYGRRTDDVSQSADTNAVTTLSAGKGIALNAGDEFNDQAAQITAGGAVSISGANGVNILSGNDISNYDEVATNFFAGVTLGAQAPVINAAKDAMNLATKAADISDGYSAANAAFAGLAAYDDYKNIMNGGNLVSISLTAGFTYSKTETELSTSTPVTPTIIGGSVDISTNGDFVSRGLQMAATGTDSDDPNNGDISITAGNIDMGGAWAMGQASSSSESAGASIGVSVGVGITGVNAGVTGGVSAGESQSDSSSRTAEMSTVSAANTITFNSTGNTTLDNTIFSAGSVIGNVGGDLDIISTPSTGGQSNSSASAGISFGSGGIGGITGANVGGSTGKGSTNWIDQPSGLYSTGDQDITVGGNTNLAASGLISTEGTVDLTTGTLTWSDFDGSKEYKNIGADLGLDFSTGKDKDGHSTANETLSGTYQLDDERQDVKATISGNGGPGNVTITDPNKQAQLEQSGATKPSDQINTDPTQQNVITKDVHHTLDVYLSTQSLQAAVKAGQTITQVLGQAFGKMFADGTLSQSDRLGVAYILAHLNDPSVQRQLTGCAGNHAENEYNFFDWLITPAYADVESCPITDPQTGITYTTSKTAAETCLEAWQKATASGVEVAENDDPEDDMARILAQIPGDLSEEEYEELRATGQLNEYYNERTRLQLEGLDKYYGVGDEAEGGTNATRGVLPAPAYEVPKGYSATGNYTADGRPIFSDGDGGFVAPDPTMPTSTGSTVVVNANGQAVTASEWSATKTLSETDNALGHADKHLVEFPEYSNNTEYINGAQDFVSNPPSGTLTKTRANGDTLYYNPSTNTFAVSNSSGVPRTMFRPSNGINYWNVQ